MLNEIHTALVTIKNIILIHNELQKRTSKEEIDQKIDQIFNQIKKNVLDQKFTDYLQVCEFLLSQEFID